MNRGEIWSVAGGVYATKPRPAVILQDDRFADTESVTVCPLTSMSVDAPLLRLRIESSSRSGLDTASWVMIDKITTVRRTNVARRIGRLSAAELVEFERLLAVFLGLAD
ncbi:type II toxin-antitoxin system PemK/MazF family toxin [Paramicrobacterium fandaimingii]|uniref:type II toxin-antitoxin system PemK/MazF family toxin n=1 Tax=Paramicrobacterium fandaimingii TaxID=2708079 RepID=UPI00141FCB11|nr:type II toxin-antitoxin system PemK/MazF family toxin [Microbacterium fandaimingii]